jgi:hypothetical protein
MQHNTMNQMLCSASSETIQKSTRTFWEGQNAFLDQMQTFMNGWFERRHAGTKAALEAAERMSRATTPAEWLAEYQKWFSGSMERIMVDAQACQDQMRNVTVGLTTSLVPSAEQEQDSVVPEKTKKSAQASAR